MSADLGALVASPHFRWMPGMLDAAHYMRIVCVFDDGTAVWAGDERVRNHYNLADSRPDLADPATRGCLLHLVREACPGAEVTLYHDGVVHVEWPDGWDEYPDVSAALLAAPPKRGS